MQSDPVRYCNLSQWILGRPGYLLCCYTQPIARGCRGLNASSKSAKRFNFNHKVNQKWGFCSWARGWGLWGSKSPLLGSKRSTFGGPAPPSTLKSILAIGLAIHSLQGWPFAGRASNWESNKLGCYITMYLPIARAVILRGRNRSVRPPGNVFIHNTRLSLQMVKPCKERKWLYHWKLTWSHSFLIHTMKSVTFL